MAAPSYALPGAPQAGTRRTVVLEEAPSGEEAALAVDAAALTRLIELKWFGSSSSLATDTDTGSAPGSQPPPHARGHAIAKAPGSQPTSSGTLYSSSGGGPSSGESQAQPSSDAGAHPNGAAQQGSPADSRRLAGTSADAAPSRGHGRARHSRAPSQNLQVPGNLPSSAPAPALDKTAAPAAAGGQAAAAPAQVSPLAQNSAALGTWAERQHVFSDMVQREEAEQAQQRQQKQARRRSGGGSAAAAAAAQSPETIPEEAAAPAAAPGAAAAAADAAGPSASSPPPADVPGAGPGAEGPVDRRTSYDGSEADEMNAAWRWRFSRKWQVEQAKQFDPDFGKTAGDEDEWDGALGYMEAVGGGLALQIARTTSVDHSGRFGASLSMASPSMSQSMLLEGGKESPLRDDSNTMDATKQVVSVARKAQHLMARQQEIEAAVERRWESAAGAAPPTWVGAHLPAVQIDSWGSYPFVLARVTDRGGRQKLLVRGKNGTDEGQALATLQAEVASSAVRQRLPGPKVEMLGVGSMEWSRQRDRCLAVAGSRVTSTVDQRVKSKEDIARLVGALAQSSLPPNFKISVDI